MLAKELPVYIDTKQLWSRFHNAVKEFPKQDRYTIGDKLLTLTIDCLELIQAANSDIQGRKDALTRLQIKVGTIETLVDMLNTKHIVHIKQAAELTMLIGRIARQVNGWKNRC